MMMQDNVSLVTESIDRITVDGVLTKDGVHHPADILVLATGFAMTKMMQQMALVGRGGMTMRDRWGEDNPRSYLGTMVPGFPNLFLMVGPNGAGTHGAALPIFSEAQTTYILSCLDVLFAINAKTMEPKEDTYEDYNRHVDEALEKMVWNHKNVTTYYRNSQGRNFVSYPWRLVDFWNAMRAPKLDDMVIR
jgi:4-hydroxyacetophenone monooxygenase